jgi:cellulose synthase/poly-beta-1,6-N-acetylglucosamine synthase-like glycosyltransferase
LNKRKRQWGTEKETTPLSRIHDQPSVSKIAFARLAIVLTVIFWLLYVTSIIFGKLFEGPNTYRFNMEVISYLIVVTFLTLSAFLYLVARQGAFQRFSKHVRVPRAVLDRYFSQHQPSITVLVPSYNEEPQVIRKTLLSAALQEYSNIKIVLLVDDDRKKIKQSDEARFESVLSLGDDIQKLLSKPYQRFKNELDLFEKQSAHKKSAPTKIAKKLASEYLWAARWLAKLANSEQIEDHVDEFFADQVLRELANDLNLVAEALLVSYQEGVELTRSRVHQLYGRLVKIFGCEVTVFERKKYISLSHEANKAMNLNAYIGLMGGTYRQEQIPDGLILNEVKSFKNGDIKIPDSEFILTLDADSILLRDYCLRLVYFLQQPDNANVAVTQTPYSSFRGASTRIERLSGATTDIQHILHQGMSHYGATFWVGANAVIRKRALDDIVRKEWIGGFEIKRYVQDNTVIEDTESSIDLAINGWELINYPERLSYSATPPDFGSLVVQRRRWANGGLLILPKLLAQVMKLKNKNKQVSRLEILLRLNYMASIAWSNFGLVFLLAYPYDGRLLSPFVLLAALPYFIAMASDLKYCRYKYSDAIRIYGFNLILLPVNLAGVLKSIQQALTAKKIPFARTPKVKNRTAVELTFVLAPLLIVAFSAFTFWRNYIQQNWGNAMFAGFNTLAASWAILSFIGLGSLLTDLWLGFTNMLYTDVSSKQSNEPSNTELKLDWKVVLYHGEKNGFVPHASVSELVSKNGKN